MEKWRIRVDDTPLLVVDMDIVEHGAYQKIIFRLKTDELVLLDKAHSLFIENAETQPHPILHLDHGLCARLTTSLFYRLIDGAQQRRDEIGIYSDGEWFVLAKTSD